MIMDTAIIHPLAPHADEIHLTELEQQRAASFRFPDDAARWTAWRSGLRRILGQELGLPPLEVPLLLGEFGKPELAAPFESLHFSLSHCNDFALVALLRGGPVGIDLEPLSRAAELSGCEETFCHPAEIAALPSGTSDRNHVLLELWTAKEALLKALGTGFSHPPEKVRIDPGPDCFTATSEIPLPGIADLCIHRLHHPILAAHCAALSVPARISRLEFHAPAGSTSGAPSVIALPHSMKSDG